MKHLIQKSPNVMIIQEWSKALISNDDKEYYKNFLKENDFKVALIEEDKLTLLNESDLDNIVHADIVISKNIDQIIKEFKPLER